MPTSPPHPTLLRLPETSVKEEVTSKGEVISEAGVAVVQDIAGVHEAGVEEATMATPCRMDLTAVPRTEMLDPETEVVPRFRDSLPAMTTALMVSKVITPMDLAVVLHTRSVEVLVAQAIPVGATTEELQVCGVVYREEVLPVERAATVAA